MATLMDADDSQPSDALVPVLTWPGRRPSLADLGTWHEALTNTVAGLVAADIVALWLYPSRGGAVLIGPSGLSAERMPPPPAEPLVSQEGLYALEDRLRAAGYSSVLAVPIRAEMQDVGLLLIGSLRNDAHTLADLRLLHRTAAQLATACRRLAAFSWVVPGPVADERSAIIANVTEGVLEAIGRAREGGDLVQLVSDALSNQVPHDRCELIAVAPAPDCWALLSSSRSTSGRITLDAETTDAVDALVFHLGSRSVARIPDLRFSETPWPSLPGSHPQRVRSLLAARLDIGDEFVGWLCLGSETPAWFREEDEAVAQLAARILAARVAGWTAKAELRGAWR
ncbi:MAG: GAF domain-containing protein [Gemmatimonadetes bacterium]|nr:GAF domain-containing protein [Gemmatimonadota bacterium]MBL0178641.1 GAF domain-containing protein [Gemmatimonadota bacterium]